MYVEVVKAAPHRPSNRVVARHLEEIADLLEGHGASGFRVRAYRDAARTIDALEEPVVDVLDRAGLPGLIAIPTIGRSIARAIEELAWRGRLARLDRLRGQGSPEELFMTLPGVGAHLASRFHHELGVDTLEALEIAAHDGRLAAMRGVGPRRLQAIRDLLAVQLGRSAGARTGPPRIAPPAPAAPSVDLLLRLDDEYREQAAAGVLPTIAPRRANPGRAAWLPVWHVDADGFHFTLLFSSSRLAHDLDKARDWVVVYWDRDGEEDQATVVTEFRGPLRGRRVVRGRERECLAFWARATEAKAARARRRRARS